MEGAICKNCIYFSDFSDVEPDDEPNGYCTYDFINKVPNDYGGHWTHTESTCMQHTFGEPLWVRDGLGGNRLRTEVK